MRPAKAVWVLVALTCLSSLTPRPVMATISKLQNKLEKLPSVSSLLPSVDKGTLARYVLGAVLWKLRRKLFSGNARGGPEFHYHHHSHKHYHHYYDGLSLSSVQPLPLPTIDTVGTTTLEEPVLGWSGLLVPQKWADS